MNFEAMTLGAIDELLASNQVHIDQHGWLPGAVPGNWFAAELRRHVEVGRSAYISQRVYAKANSSPRALIDALQQAERLGWFRVVQLEAAQ